MPGLFFFGGEESSEDRPGADELEEVVRDGGRAAAGECTGPVIDRDLPSLPRGDCGKGARAVTYLEKVCVRDGAQLLVAAHAADMNELVGALVRQGAKQDAVDDAEHRRRRPDAESEGNDRDAGDEGPRGERAKGEAHILPRRMHLSSAGSWATAEPLEYSPGHRRAQDVGIEPSVGQPPSPPWTRVERIFLDQVPEDLLAVVRVDCVRYGLRDERVLHALPPFGSRRASMPLERAASMRRDRCTAATPWSSST